MNQKISAEDRAAICLQYEAGANSKDLAESFGVGRRTVQMVLQRAGISRPSRPPLPAAKPTPKRSKQPRERWSPEEVAVLLELAGDVPWKSVLRRYWSWARKYGYPSRTDGALRAVCERHGATRVANGEWITTGAIRELTGAGPPRIQRWIQRGLVEARREGKRWYISRKSLRDLARQQPEQFAGSSISDLTQLLDSQRLAEQIAALPPTWIPGRPRPVRCVETGEVFPSCEEAGRRFYVTRSAVYLAAAGKRKHSGGHQFLYAA